MLAIDWRHAGMRAVRVAEGAGGKLDWQAAGWGPGAGTRLVMGKPCLFEKESSTDGFNAKYAPEGPHVNA